MMTKRCWWRVARSFPLKREKTGTMLRRTSQTSIAPMAFRLQRAMQADVDRAGLADNADRVAAAIAGRVDGADAAEDVPVDRAVAVDRRAAAEIAKLDFLLGQ
jgi:hypothetical protein